MTMKRSYLIQRLNPPLGGDLGAKLSAAFVFGGGLPNGGMSPEVTKAITSFCSFDYMGASEFEHGALVDGLRILAKKVENEDSISWVAVEISPDEVTHDPYKSREDVKRTEPLEIYVIYATSELDEVAERVRELAINPEEQRPLENPQLSRKVLYTGPYDNTIGWIELNNGWIATTEESVRDGFLKLFGWEEG